MIVENRKTLKRSDITKQDWENLIKIGSHRLFKVVDKEDTTPVYKRISVPDQIKEFQANLRIDISKAPEVKPTNKTTKK
jgi:hypothetical protein